MFGDWGARLGQDALYENGVMGAERSSLDRGTKAMKNKTNGPCQCIITAKHGLAPLH